MMLKRFFLLATLIGVFACGVFFFTGNDASAHGIQVIRGNRLAVVHERRSCEHVVIFDVRNTNHQHFQVFGPDRTHPTIISTRGHQVIAKYNTQGYSCAPDYRHHAQQFILRVF